MLAAELVSVLHGRGECDDLPSLPCADTCAVQQGHGEGDLHITWRGFERRAKQPRRSACQGRSWFDANGTDRPCARGAGDRAGGDADHVWAAAYVHGPGGPAMLRPCARAGHVSVVMPAPACACGKVTNATCQPVQLPTPTLCLHASRSSSAVGPVCARACARAALRRSSPAWLSRLSQASVQPRPRPAATRCPHEAG